VDNKKPTNGAGRAMKRVVNGSSDWNGSLLKLRTLIDEGDFDDHTDRISVVVQQPPPAPRSLRPSPKTVHQGKIAGILIGVGLGLAAVVELVVRVLPGVLEALR